MKLRCADGPAKGAVLNSKRTIPNGYLWPVMCLRINGHSEEILHTIYRRDGRYLEYDELASEHNLARLKTLANWN